MIRKNIFDLFLELIQSPFQSIGNSRNDCQMSYHWFTHSMTVFIGIGGHLWKKWMTKCSKEYSRGMSYE